MSTGPVGGDSWLTLLDAMKRLRVAWPARGWSWDARLSCVASSFNIEVEAQARTAAAIALTNEWTWTTMQRAPAPLRDVAERTGGLRAGQMLLASQAVGAVFAYGLWWPWGNGMTTSVRIGLDGSGATQDAVQRMRSVFGVEL
jgi:hypothetical protein